MRPWEVTLIVVTLLQLIGGAGLAVGLRFKPFIALLPLTAGFVTLIHFFTEQPRWQMAPIYLIVVILATVILYRVGQPPLIDRAMWQWLGVLGAIVLLVGGLALSVVFPIPNLPGPAGPYAVGTQTVHFVDQTRPERYTDDPDDVREIMTQLWYPAIDNPAVPFAPYFPDAHRMVSAIAEAVELPPFLLNHVSLMKSHAKLNLAAPSGDERFPIILFSHGYGSTRIQSTLLMETLASHGYVVASLDHPYGAAVTVFPDGRVALLSPDALTGEGAAFRRSGIRLVDGWVGDLALVASQLEQLDNGEINSPLNGRLDLERLGMMGHSTGGGAIARFCATDSRCQAAVGLDAWMAPVPNELLAQGTTAPFLFFMTEKWPQSENIGYIAAYMDQSPNSTWITLAGADHYDFTDAPFLSPLLGVIGIDVGLDPRVAHTLTDEVVLGYFDEKLRDQSGRFAASTGDSMLLFNQEAVFRRAGGR